MSKRPAHRGGAAESDDSDGTGDDPPPGPVVVARPGPPKRGRPPGATAKKKLEDPHYQCRWCTKTYGAKGGLRAHAREKHATQYAAAGAGSAHVSHLGEWREGRVRLSATAPLAPAPPMPARPRAPPLTGRPPLGQAAAAAAAAPAHVVDTALLDAISRLPERASHPDFQPDAAQLAACGSTVIELLRRLPATALPVGDTPEVWRLGAGLYALHAMLVGGRQGSASGATLPPKSMRWVVAAAYALWSPGFVEEHGGSAQRMIEARSVFGKGSGCSVVEGWRDPLWSLAARIAELLPVVTPAPSPAAPSPAASGPSTAPAPSPAASAPHLPPTLAAAPPPPAAGAPLAPAPAPAAAAPHPDAGRLAATAKAAIAALLLGPALTEQIWRSHGPRILRALADLQPQTRPEALRQYTEAARKASNMPARLLGLAPVDATSVAWLLGLTDATLRSFLEMVLRSMADPSEVTTTAARGALSDEQRASYEQAVRALLPPEANGVEAQCAVARGLLLRSVRACACPELRAGDCNPDRSVGGDAAADVDAMLRTAPTAAREASEASLALLTAHPLAVAGPEGGAPTAHPELRRVLDTWAARGDLARLVPVLLAAKGRPGAPTGKVLRALLHSCLLAWPAAVVTDMEELWGALQGRLDLLDWLRQPLQAGRLHTAVAADARRACERGPQWLEHAVVGQEVRRLATGVLRGELDGLPAQFGSTRAPWMFLRLLDLLEATGCLSSFGTKRATLVCAALRMVIAEERFVDEAEVSAQLERIAEAFALLRGGTDSEERQAVRTQLAVATAAAAEAAEAAAADEGLEAEEAVDGGEAELDGDGDELPGMDDAAPTGKVATLLGRVISLQRRKTAEARLEVLLGSSAAPLELLRAVLVAPPGGGRSLLGAAPCTAARPQLLELLSNLPEEELTSLEEQQLQNQLDQPAWFRRALHSLLRGGQAVSAAKLVREQIEARMAVLAVEEAASGGLPSVADFATKSQLGLEPPANWSPPAQIAKSMIEHADEPSLMSPAAQKCWPFVPPEVQKSYEPVAKQLRSTKAEIIKEHGGRWCVASAKEYYAVLNAVEAVMNRRLEWAGVPLVRTPARTRVLALRKRPCASFASVSRELRQPRSACAHSPHKCVAPTHLRSTTPAAVSSLRAGRDVLPG
jgi:hypothetical protein